MEATYSWRCMNPVNGNHMNTRYQLTEEQAHATVIDPERIDHDPLTAEPLPTVSPSA
jgi:hypothetical protein